MFGVFKLRVLAAPLFFAAVFLALTADAQAQLFRRGRASCGPQGCQPQAIQPQFAAPACGGFGCHSCPSGACQVPGACGQPACLGLRSADDYSGGRYDPYRIRSEAEFNDFVKGTGEAGLVVGAAADPFVGTYRNHWSAPAGYRGLADGAYLAATTGGTFTAKPFGQTRPAGKKPADADESYRNCLADVMAGNSVSLFVGFPAEGRYTPVYVVPSGYKGLKDGEYRCYRDEAGKPQMAFYPVYPITPMPAGFAHPVQGGFAVPQMMSPFRLQTCPPGGCR